MSERGERGNEGDNVHIRALFNHGSCEEYIKMEIELH